MGFRASTPFVIQFPHPGGSASRLRPPSKAWAPSTQKHSRAMLEARGDALRSLQSNDRVQGTLRFWGEWEADAIVVALPAASAAPFVQVPVLKSRASYTGLHNTDPFIFDGPFLYSNCRQRGVLTQLDRGSVVIFGSKNGSTFVVDTVFVVRERRKEYVARSAVAELESIAPRSFIHAVAQPIQASARAMPRPGCIPNAAKFILYEGATPDEPVDGMFSFVPAVEAPSTFERPAVSVPKLNPESSRTFKVLLQESTNRIRPVWQSLVQQAVSRRVLLGTRFELEPSSTS